MQNIFNYVDYREYVRDWYREVQTHNSSYSYRSMAAALDINSGTLSRILKSERNIRPEVIERFSKLMKLSTVDGEYFELLIQFEQAGDTTIKREIYRKIIIFRTKRKKSVSANQADYFGEWFHTAIRELLRLNGTLTAGEIKQALSPEPTLSHVKKSLQLLLDIEMIREENGVFFASEQLLTICDSWRGVAVQEYQSQMMTLGIESLDRHSWQERDISTVSITINNRDLDKAQEILKNAREELLQLEEQTIDHNRVYQCNIQLFPLTHILEK